MIISIKGGMGTYITITQIDERQASGTTTKGV